MAGRVPGAVPGVVARFGGGSGELAVEWNAVARATGYRVLRTETEGGPFTVVAEIDVTTGEATAAPEVVTIWSEEHGYVPPRGAVHGRDRSPWFEYIEVGGDRRRGFRVIAFNAAGDGPPSPVRWAAYP